VIDTARCERLDARIDMRTTRHPRIPGASSAALTVSPYNSLVCWSEAGRWTKWPATYYSILAQSPDNPTATTALVLPHNCSGSRLFMNSTPCELLQSVKDVPLWHSSRQNSHYPRHVATFPQRYKQSMCCSCSHAGACASLLIGAVSSSPQCNMIEGWCS